MSTKGVFSDQHKLSLSHKEVNVSGFTISMNFWAWVSPWINQLGNVDDLGTMVSLFHGYDMDYFIDRGKFIMAHNEVCRKLEENELPMDLVMEKTHELGERILKIVLANYTKVKRLRIDELELIMTSLFNWSREICSYGYMAVLMDFPEEYITPRMEEILKLKCKNSKADARLTLISSHLKKPAVLATEELCRLVSAGGNLNEWLDKWFWLDFGHIGTPLTEDKMREKYAHILADKNSAEAELAKIEQYHSQIQDRQQTLVSELDLTDKEKNIFETAQKCSYLKGYRMDILSASNAFFDHVFTAYAEKWGWDKDIFRFSTKEEVLSYFESTKPDVKKILSRKQESVWAVNNDNEGVIILQGKEADDFVASRLVTEIESMSSELIKGNTAYPGVVKGPVRIVMNASDLGKVQDGDVLVAVQTTPELLPGMKKAIAFVTDIGGITSHAAIVSREMKKPCVVGAKNATKVLKDGDMVKVDADHGYILLLP
ncbi:MAG: PEP-utilizing enzyme [Patescibacteria group bacterium]|nr:PEP-utilizing enzyme [Patescibacteria group bacterium]